MLRRTLLAFSHWYRKENQARGSEISSLSPHHLRLMNSLLRLVGGWIWSNKRLVHSACLLSLTDLRIIKQRCPNGKKNLGQPIGPITDRGPQNIFENNIKWLLGCSISVFTISRCTPETKYWIQKEGKKQQKKGNQGKTKPNKRNNQPAQICVT